MSDTKYTVTFRMAKWGDIYDDPNDRKGAITSSGGHLWYALYEDGKFLSSAGFQSVEGKPFGSGKITDRDEVSYINSPYSISIQLNQQQFEVLSKFGEDSGKNAETMGFDAKNYNVASNSCVSYVFKALNLIGYNPKDINPQTMFSDSNRGHDVEFESMASIANAFSGAPGFSFKEVIRLLAENGAIGVDGNKLIPVSEQKNIRSIQTNNKITGYDGNSDEIHGGDGNDTLIGKGGDDELYGGRGNDVLYGDYTTDSASSSSSSSTFSTGYTADNNRTFSASSDSSSSNESSNRSGNDILNGGAGNDILNGGKGYDKYYIGDKDVIIDSDGLGEIRFLNKAYQVRPETESSSKHIITGYDEEEKRLPTSFVYKKNDKVIYRFEAEGASFVSAKSLGKTAYELQSHYLWDEGSNEKVVWTAKRLMITEVETGHQAVINNFVNGMLGIQLETERPFPSDPCYVDIPGGRISWGAISTDISAMMGEI